MVELEIKDWISIASIVASLVTATCTALFFYKRQSIVNKFNKDLESHKANLAKDISRNSTTLEERISVMKEVLRFIAKLNQEVNQLQSYNNYECKDNIEFSNKEKCSHKCDKKCIVHLWDHICNLEEDIRKFDEYLTSVMPLLSYSAELVLNSYVMLILAMSRKAIEKGTKPSDDHKGNMLNSMSVFGAVSMDTLKETYDKLVFMYRYMLDTPIEEYPTAKLSELINKNNSIVEQVLKQ